MDPQANDSSFFDQICALTAQPVPTDDTPDDTAFGPDSDATQEEILQAIKESVALDD